MIGDPAAGHELSPHTADVMLSAWAPTVEGCLAEAIRAIVDAFADVSTARPARLVPFSLDPAPDDEMLVQVLEEVIYLLDTEDAVPVQATLTRTAQGGLVGEFGIAPRGEVTVTGPAPKAVTRHGLRFEQRGGLWHCQVVIDV